MGQFLGRATLIILILFGIAFLFMIIGAGIQYLKGGGGEAILVMTVGLLVALVEWVASWPWWVWMVLVAVFIAVRLDAGLERVSRRLGRLERRVAALTRAVGKGEGDFDGDEL